MIRLKQILLEQQEINPSELCLKSDFKDYRPASKRDKLQSWKDFPDDCKEKFWEFLTSQKATTIRMNYGWTSSTDLADVNENDIAEEWHRFSGAFYRDYLNLEKQNDNTWAPNLRKQDDDNPSNPCSKPNHHPFKLANGKIVCYPPCPEGQTRNKTTGKCEKTTIEEITGIGLWTIVWWILAAAAGLKAGFYVIGSIPGIKGWIRRLSPKAKNMADDVRSNDQVMLKMLKGGVLGAKESIAALQWASKMIAGRQYAKADKFLRMFEDPNSPVYATLKGKVTQQEINAMARQMRTAYSLHFAIRKTIYDSAKEAFKTGRLSVDALLRMFPKSIYSTPEGREFVKWAKAYQKEFSGKSGEFKLKSGKTYKMFDDVIAKASQMPLDGDSGESGEDIVPDQYT